MYYYDSFYPFHMNWWGPVFMIFFWVLIVALIVRVFRGPRRWDRHWDMMGKSNAMDILKERYAKGEITKEQFEQMKKDIL